jgi:hypothetical protein
MKITGFLLLFFALSLAVVNGCDEDNNMLSQPPGAEEPPTSSKCEGIDLDKCPCDYDIIPKTMACWTLEGTQYDI